eukprot:Em0003g1376a
MRMNVATPWNGSVPVCLMNLNSTTTKVCRRTTVGIMQATDEADLKRSSKEHCCLHRTEYEALFQKLRLKLMSPPVLAYPDDSRSFILDTDASNTRIGCVLSQMQNDGSEHIIATAVCCNCTLFGKHLTLCSDHGLLKWLGNFMEPEGQLARWLEKLEEYNFTIIHRPEQLHLDQGRQFESDLMAEGDGLVENFNRTLLDMLATVTKEQPGDWDRHL